MSKRDSPPEGITRPEFYEAALWFMRLSYVCAAFWILNMGIIRTRVDSMLPWSVGAVLGVISAVLLVLAGARFEYRGGRFHGRLYLGGDAGRQFFRDVFWLPRRPPA